jgi:hypothetical protein
VSDYKFIVVLTHHAGAYYNAVILLGQLALEAQAYTKLTEPTVTKTTGKLLADYMNYAFTVITDPAPPTKKPGSPDFIQSDLGMFTV